MCIYSWEDNEKVGKEMILDLIDQRMEIKENQGHMQRGV